MATTNLGASVRFTHIMRDCAGNVCVPKFLDDFSIRGAIIFTRRRRQNMIVDSFTLEEVPFTVGTSVNDVSHRGFVRSWLRVGLRI